MNCDLTAQASKLPTLAVSYPSKPPYDTVQNPKIVLSRSCTTNILTAINEETVDPGGAS